MISNYGWEFVENTNEWNVKKYTIHLEEFVYGYFSWKK